MKFLADNWWYILIVAVMAYMMIRGGGCCGGEHGNHRGHNDSHDGGCCGGEHMDHQKHNEHNGGYIKNSTNINIDTAKDPVCGMNVSKKDAISRNIDGKTYYFCSKNCANEFEINHAQYK